MSENGISVMAGAAKKLLDGQHKLAEFRRRFGRNLHFAADNDVVMDFVSPSAKHARQVRQLLRDEDGFSVKDQELSLVERVAGYVLFDAAKEGSGKIYSLPGHHTELWGSLAGGIHTRLTSELKAGGNASQVAEQIQRFRDKFYHAAITADKKLTIDELIAAVPDQMRGWLGVGPASMEWDRLKYLKVRSVLHPFPKEVIDQPQLLDPERDAFFISLLTSRDKWQLRLETARNDWIAQGGDSNERSLINLRNDAVALAYWEFLNKEFFRPPQRLALVTWSDRIYDAARAVSAAELGGESTEFASDYLLCPFDFLDECHLSLSGELGPTSDADDSGKLSSALKMLVSAESSQSVRCAEEEFGVVWGKFLRTSVLERVKKINRAQNTHLRRVAFVFSRVGISAETTSGNPLVHKLAESGSEMLSEAADIRIASLAPAQFTRGAPILRLDKHPWAQKIQLERPQEYGGLLIDPDKRKVLLHEAGEHRYTLHLLQARAMIWAGDWRTALRLAEFALTVRDKLPKPADSIVPDIDGREAEFLAAVCERHAYGTSVSSLQPALDRASRHLNNFDTLAVDAACGGAISEIDLQVHKLRSFSERIAIDTIKFLLGTFTTLKHKTDGYSFNSLSDLEITVLLSDIRNLRLITLDVTRRLGEDFDGIFLRYICARMLQQTWCNELQIRLFSACKLRLCELDDLERLWSEQNEIRKSICAHQEVKVPTSWFVDTLTYVLGAVLGHDTGKNKDALLSRLTSAEMEHTVFLYDSQRNARLRELVETA